MAAELADGLLQLVELAGAEGFASVQEGSVAILGETGSARASNRGAKRVRNFMLDYGDARANEDNTGWRRALRRDMVARRAALSEAEHDVLSARIVAHLIATLPVPQVVAFCWPIKHEPDVRASCRTGPGAAPGPPCPSSSRKAPRSPSATGRRKRRSNPTATASRRRWPANG